MPFYTNKGYHPNFMVHLEHDLASAHACDFITDLDELHRELKQQIADAQCCYQQSADSQRSLALEFKIGSQAFVQGTVFPYDSTFQEAL